LAGINHTIEVTEITAIPGGEVIDVITATSPGISTFEALDYQQGVSLVVFFFQQVSGNNLRISTTRTPYSNFADTDNQWQVAEALYNSVGLSTGDLGQVLAHLDFLPLQDLQNAFEELQPKPYAIHPSLILQEADFLGSNITDRLRDRRQELVDSEPFDEADLQNSSSPATQERFIPEPLNYTADISQPVSLSGEQSRWKTYVQTYALWTKEEADTSIDGFEAITLGTLLGTDRGIGQSLIGGFCFGTGITDISTVESGSNGDKLSLRFGSYLSYFKDGFVVEGFVTAGANWFNNQRSIDITGLSRSAECSYDSYDLAVELAALYELKFWGFTLAPELRMVYDYIYLDDFQETGADSISLVVFDRQIHSLNHIVGSRLGYDIKFAQSLLRPEAWVTWTHDYLDDEQVVQASLAGAPQNDFTISAPEIRRETVQWGAGLTFSHGRVFSSYLRFQAEIYPDVWNQRVYGGFQFQF
jgi:outer membrane autotransporter protein